MTPPLPWPARRLANDRALLALGAMNFGKRTRANDAMQIMDRAIERGITLFDTANAYNDGESERIVGRALRGRRDRIQVATKVGFARIDKRPEGLSRDRILAAADDSLARLQTDYIDVYYLHVPDRATPIENSLSAIRDLLAQGKIRHFAVSNYASWEILEIMWLCDKEGMPRPIFSQVLYNLLIRQLDLEYFRFVQKHPVHTTVFNPLAGGLLSGTHASSNDEAPKGSRFSANRLYQGRYWSERMFELVAEYRSVAESEGMTLVDLSYAWLAQHADVGSILVGPASTPQLDAAIDSVEKSLSTEALARIETIHRAFLGTDTSYAR